MNKFFSSITPAAIALAVSLGGVTLGCAAVHAATSQGSTSTAVSTSTPVIAHTSASVKTQHGLTRRAVYDQLVQAEKDGSLARINALYMGS